MAPLDALYPSLEALYTDLHRNPELSGMEVETAAKLAARMRALGYEVTERVGGHGVVAVLKNGAGPTVMIRTDMDALPIREETGLPYASKVLASGEAGEQVPVMHACGHDVHMVSWLGAATLLAQSRTLWSGTLVFVGQPAEETLQGARAMVADGLLTRFPRPDVALAIHATNMLPAGQVGLISGPAAAATNGVDIVFHGKGGHGASPHLTIDPILLAARTVVSLQSIVSREINPMDPAVVTVGTFHAGTRRNIIPEDATLQLTIRSYKPEVQARILASIARIANAESAVAGAAREPTITIDEKDGVLAVYNDPAVTARLSTALTQGLVAGAVAPISAAMASEDFSVYSEAGGMPSVQLRLGSVEPREFAKAKAAGSLVPGAHTSRYAPDPEPTLRTGTAALTLSALELLSGPAE
jgi:amidohydrolase